MIFSALFVQFIMKIRRAILDIIILRYRVPFTYTLPPSSARSRSHRDTWCPVWCPPPGSCRTAGGAAAPCSSPDRGRASSRCPPHRCSGTRGRLEGGEGLEVQGQGEALHLREESSTHWLPVMLPTWAEILSSQNNKRNITVLILANIFIGSREETDTEAGLFSWTL